MKNNLKHIEIPIKNIFAHCVVLKIVGYRNLHLFALAQVESSQHCHCWNGEFSLKQQRYLPLRFQMALT